LAHLLMFRILVVYTMHLCTNLVSTCCQVGGMLNFHGIKKVRWAMT